MCQHPPLGSRIPNSPSSLLAPLNVYPVEPGLPREIYDSDSAAYFTGVPSGCSTGAFVFLFNWGALQPGKLFSFLRVSPFTQKD